MRPGNPYLVKCPFCGEMKKVFNLISGNTFDSELWSDTKLIAEMFRIEVFGVGIHEKDIVFRF